MNGADETGPRVCAVAVRRRRASDLAACVRLLAEVHRADGYPVRLPPDPAAFVEVPDPLGAWVAEDGSGLIGHAALRTATSAPVMAAAEAATGLAPERLAVVARLFVAPRARRRGVGGALLGAAVAHAHGLGRRPVLDVVTGDLAAIALYDGSGWRRAATVRVRFGDLVVDEHVFVGPSPDGR